MVAIIIRILVFILVFNLIRRILGIRKTITKKSSQGHSPSRAKSNDDIIDAEYKVID